MAEKLPNVYENLTEALFRLHRTVVMYDGEPFNVIAITNHRDDGVFRVYLQPISWDGKDRRPMPDIQNIPVEHPGIGKIIDDWMETDVGKKSGVLRKRMDSKYFDRFRPFPLGMCNHGSHCYYIEWSPLRSQHQGLTNNAIVQETISLAPNKSPRSGAHLVETYSPSFYECIRGEHPDAITCLEALKDPSIENEAHAFDRRFAFVRGPIDMIFLAYKTDIIGWLPKLDFTYLRLGRSYVYCKEVVAELDLFENILTM